LPSFSDSHGNGGEESTYSAACRSSVAWWFVFTLISEGTALLHNMVWFLTSSSLGQGIHGFTLWYLSWHQTITWHSKPWNFTALMWSTRWPCAHVHSKLQLNHECYIVNCTESNDVGIRCADHATPSIRKSWH
jgi:hypothetical protein